MTFPKIVYGDGEMTNMLRNVGWFGEPKDKIRQFIIHVSESMKMKGLISKEDIKRNTLKSLGVVNKDSSYKDVVVEWVMREYPTYNYEWLNPNRMLVFTDVNNKDTELLNNLKFRWVEEKKVLIKEIRILNVRISKLQRDNDLLCNDLPAWVKEYVKSKESISEVSGGDDNDEGFFQQKK